MTRRMRNETSFKPLQLGLFLLGLSLIVAPLFAPAEAAQNGQITYNDQRMTEVVNGVPTYLEGSLGAMVMVACGVFTICAAAFGQYRVAIGLMVVAIGSFTLRSFMGTFFNDVNITNGDVAGSGIVAPSATGLIAELHGQSVDVYTRIGTDVLAYDNGEVFFTGQKEGYGNVIVLNHQDGLQTYYGHLHRIDVTVGQKIQKGQPIGVVGDTGKAREKGSHLHFEVRQSGKKQRFQRYIPEAEVSESGRVNNPDVLNGRIVNTAHVDATPSDKKHISAPGVDFEDF